MKLIRQTKLHFKQGNSDELYEVDPRPAAYSSLTICKDGTIGVLYEPGYQAVRFARFTLEDLTDGEDRLAIPFKPVN